MCPTIILSKKGATVISYCPDCKNIYIWHNNLMLSFLEHQFMVFRKHTICSDFQEKFYNFPDGEERLVLNTPHPDICFSFTEDEWTNFSIAMEEATYMQSIYKLVYC